MLAVFVYIICGFDTYLNFTLFCEVSMADKEKLKELLDQNYKHAEIAKILGITRARVTSLANKMGYKSNRAINIELLKSEVQNGMSFSEFSRTYGHTLAAVSKAAKNNNIISKSTNHLPINIPIEALELYDAGTGIHSLAKKYNTNYAHVQRCLKRMRPDIVFRTHDESVRPSLLNDKNALESELNNKSIRKIAKELGVKLKTVSNAVRKFGLSSKYYIVYKNIDYDVLYDLYCVQLLRPSKIAEITGVPYSTIIRKLRKAGFEIHKPGGVFTGSKHELLNNRDKLYDLYVNKEYSLPMIACLVKTSLRNIAYHLRRHNINARTKDEYIKLIISRSNGVKSKKYGIKLDSTLERQFINDFGSIDSIEKDVVMKNEYSIAIIDFKINGKYYEVKPKNALYGDCKERRRMIKQYLVAKANNLDIIVWTPNGEWDKRIDDNDIYHLDNWRLYFKSGDECYEWLINYGFKVPKYTKMDIYDAFPLLFKYGSDPLNANYNNSNPTIITKYFFEHFWYSKHIRYHAIPDAWDIGNRTVLKNAIETLWANDSIINIFKVVGYIHRHMIDFKFVSIFKPWVARYVYQKYLPDGGIVVDPCSGWGGRFLGANNLGNIKYIGYDFNKLSVDSIKNMCDFMKGNVTIEPEFHHGDSSVIRFPDCDLIFTSPPYDSTELYYGIDSTKTVTAPIVENIFNSGCKLVILNIPKRLLNTCNTIADKFLYRVDDVLEMKTASVAGKREKTFEPIVVYRK